MGKCRQGVTIKPSFSVLAGGYHGYLFVKELLHHFDVHKVASCHKKIRFEAPVMLKKLCIEKGIKYCTATDELLSSNDIVLVVGWPYLLNRLSNIVVLHDSILPKYKGHCPTVTALIEGDTKLGVTAFLPTKQRDSGTIVGKATVDIQYPITIKAAYETITPCYIECVKQFVSKVQIPTETQCESYSMWRNADDYKIQWHWDAKAIERHINASGWPYFGATTMRNETTIIRILEAVAVGDVQIVNRQPGKFFRLDNGCPIVVCGRGLLKIIKAESLSGDFQDFHKLKEKLS